MFPTVKLTFTECSILKRHFILGECDQKEVENQNCLKLALNSSLSNRALILDALLRLLMFSNEVRMGNLIDTFKDFKATFSVTSKTITEFMDNIFYENE